MKNKKKNYELSWQHFRLKMKVLDLFHARRAKTLKSIKVRPPPQSSRLILVTCDTHEKIKINKNKKKIAHNKKKIQRKEKSLPPMTSAKINTIKWKTKKRTKNAKANKRK